MHGHASDKVEETKGECQKTTTKMREKKRGGSNSEGTKMKDGEDQDWVDDNDDNKKEKKEGTEEKQKKDGLKLGAEVYIYLPLNQACCMHGENT